MTWQSPKKDKIPERTTPSTSTVKSGVVDDASRQNDENRAPQVPAVSGHKYHALELLRNPDQDEGQLVELDPWSFPILSRGLIVYQRLGKNIAVTNGRIGLRANRNLSDNTILYDVMLNDLSGNFLEGTDFISTGQIAVQMSKPGLSPDTLQTWDVEPMGTIDGTTAAGLVVRIPLIRFWRYHDSHLDASEPIQVQISPQKYENGWSVNAGEKLWKLPLVERRAALDQKYNQCVIALDRYEAGLQDTETRDELSALLTDAQTIREQVHEPLWHAIKSGEIKDGQAPIRHADWQFREFNAESTVEQTTDFLSGSETTRKQMHGDSDKLLSDLQDEYARIQLSFKNYRGLSPKFGCVDLTQIKRNLTELSRLLHESRTNESDRVLIALHAQMLASELTYTLGCYQSQHS